MGSRAPKAILASLRERRALRMTKGGGGVSSGAGAVCQEAGDCSHPSRQPRAGLATPTPGQRQADRTKRGTKNEQAYGQPHRAPCRIAAPIPLRKATQRSLTALFLRSLNAPMTPATAKRTLGRCTRQAMATIASTVRPPLSHGGAIRLFHPPRFLAV